MMFDVILPTVNRDSLSRAIDSVLAQTYDDFLLWIIADQCYLKEWPNDKRIIVYEITTLPNNKDHGARARNYGLLQSDRPWITYIDDDDIWLPHHLETLTRLVEQNPGVDMVRTAGQSFMMKHKSPRSSKLIRKMGPVNNTDILTVGMAHTRAIFDVTSGWQPFDNHDHYLWKEMLAQGGTAVESDEVTFWFER